MILPVRVSEYVKARAREARLCHVYLAGAITKGLQGEEMAEMGALAGAGCVCITDDGRPVMNAGLLRRALEYARTFGLPVVQHAEDLHLAEGGAMNEGAVATRAGIRAQPTCAESSTKFTEKPPVAEYKPSAAVRTFCTARSNALLV